MSSSIEPELGRVPAAVVASAPCVARVLSLRKKLLCSLNQSE